MELDRSTEIMIGGQRYELLLTTRATREIAARYGGLEHLGERLMKSESFEMALSEVVWLITLLANQSILIRNLRHPEESQPLLTEEMVELLTAPCDLTGYQAAIMEAMYRGTRRDILSEEAPVKNGTAG